MQPITHGGNTSGEQIRLREHVDPPGKEELHKHGYERAHDRHGEPRVVQRDQGLDVAEVIDVDRHAAGRD